MLKEVYHLVHQWGSRSFFKKINLSEIDYLNVKEIIFLKVIPYVICVFLRIQKFKCCCKCIYDPGLDLSGAGRWSNFSLSPWDGLGGSLTTENLNLDENVYVFLVILTYKGVKMERSSSYIWRTVFVEERFFFVCKTALQV